MTVYHFTIPSTGASERRSFYFKFKGAAVDACKKEAVYMVKDEPALAGDTITIKRSRLADLPTEDLLLCLLNQRGLLIDTVEVATVKAPKCAK